MPLATLLGFAPAASVSVDEVRLEVDRSGMLEVSLIDRGGSSDREIPARSTRRFRCEDGVMKWASGLGVAPGQTLVGVEADTVELGRTADGALIVKDTYGGAGLAYMLVPSAGSETFWYRYPPAPR